jgi:hypothetical protein
MTLNRSYGSASIAADQRRELWTVAGRARAIAAARDDDPRRRTATGLRPARLLFAVLLAALAALPVLSAAAVKPHVETEHVEFSFPYNCASGVVLTEEVTEDLRFTTFFDRAGTPVRVTVHVNYVGVVTNPVNGQSVEDLAHFTGTIDLRDGTDTTVGLYYGSTVPGLGTVVRDVGRFVRDANGTVIFEAGTHEVLAADGDPTALYCAALGA